jgi:CheY-like chemotaxis protein
MSGRVLVVDDVATNRLLLRAKLSSAYYDVVVAESGARALEIARREQPDMIMLDVMMPDMDGFAVCAALKATRDRAYPVIMVTALDTPEERVRGLEAGADDFLSKPFNDLALFARVRNLMRMKMMFDELRLRDLTSRELGLTDFVSEQDMELEPSGPVLLAPPTTSGALWASALRLAPGPRRDRDPFRARGAQPRAARAARPLRRAPGADRGRRRAPARLDAAGASRDAAVGDHPRGRQRRRADRGQGARPRRLGLHRERRST